MLRNLFENTLHCPNKGKQQLLLNSQKEFPFYFPYINKNLFECQFRKNLKCHQFQILHKTRFNETYR